MKKILITSGAAVLLIAVLAIISGCGGSQASGDAKSASTELTAEKYAQLTEGMPADQIKAIAGEPTKKESKSASGGHAMGNMSGGSMNMEYWYYQGAKGWVRLEIGEGKLTSKSGY